MKNIVKMLLIILLIMQVINIRNTNVYAENESLKSEYYYTIDNEEYGLSIGYPYWCCNVKYYDNANLSVKWFCYVHTNEDGTKGRQYVPYYLSENLADFNFTYSITGNHNRANDSISLEDAKNLSVNYRVSGTVNSSNVKSFELDGHTFYYYVVDEIVGVDNSFAQDFTKGYQNFNFQYVINNKNADKEYEKALLSAIRGEDLLNMSVDGMGNLTEASNVVYDLEVPLNFRVKQKSLVDLGIVELGKDDTFYLTWEQSDNINNNGWTTEIYFKEKGWAKKEWYSKKKYEYECNWSFYKQVDNYKGKASFNVENVNNLDEIKKLVGFKPYLTSATKLDFMIRNKWIDETNGITHYSNYVYLDNSNGSGSAGSSMDYNGYEINGEEFDKGNFEDENISNNRVTDSDAYDGSNVSGNTESNDVTSSISILKSICNDIKEFPAFFSNFMSFVPQHFVYALSALIIATIAIAFIKAVL